MSEEIDMKSYAGAISDSAAEGQTIVQDNVERMHEEAIGNFDRPQEQAQETIEQPSRQELNFRALSGEVERLKAERESERREYQLQLELIKANSQRQPEAQSQGKERKMFEGMNDDDIPTIAHMRQEWSDREDVYQKQLSQYQSNIEEMQVAINNPDYAEVLQKYAAPLLKNDPILAQGVHGADNKAMYVYRLGKLAQQLESNKLASQSQVNPTAQRIVDNAKKPGNLGSTGGQSALSKADYFASMSDKDFMEFASRNLD